MRAKGLLTYSFAAVETGLRAARLQDGRVALGRLLQDWADLVDAAYVPPLGEHLIERRTVTVDTIFGPVQLLRNYYYDGQRGFCPSDAAWGWEGHCTPTLAKWICRAGADGSYVKAGADLSEFTGGENRRTAGRAGGAADRAKRQSLAPATASGAAPRGARHLLRQLR